MKAGVKTRLSILLLSLFLYSSVKCQQKVYSSQQSVIASLDARWSTSILQEASDFFASESKSSFWSFIERVWDQIKDFDESTDKDVYNVIVTVANDLLTKSRVNFLKFSLSLRYHSPNIEAQKQMGLESLRSSLGHNENIFAEVEENFIDFNGGEILFTEEDLKSKLASLNEHSMKTQQSQVYETDIHFNLSNIALPVAIFYGNLQTKLAKEFHQLLKEAASGPLPKIDYIFRHYAKKTSGKRGVKLSGYGVELAIKSTEYKAQDDSKIQAAEGSSSSETDEEETDLNGFNFKILKQLHPDLKDQLNELKSHLLDSDELIPLKVWQLQDLSFQAGQRIVSSLSPVEALQSLAEINQNFPILARSLLKYPVKDEFRAEVENNQVKTFDEWGIGAGESALFINGLQIDFDSTDSFQLLNLLKYEEKIAQGFFNMGFRREYLSLLLNTDQKSDGMSYAVDYRNAFPDYINNLDSDKQYKEWGNSVRLIVQPYFPGMIRPIGRNFFTLVFIVDPSTTESRNLLKIAHSFFTHQIPIRIGLVFAVNMEKSVTGFTDSGVAILNAFNFVKSDKSSAKALRFIIDLFDEVGDRNIAPKDITELFQKKYPGEDVEMVFGTDSDYDKGRQAGSKFLNDSGLGKAPKVLLNGIPLDDSGITADHFEETVINEIMKLTPKLQRAVLEGKLTDEMNVADFILSQPDIMPRLSARILKPTDPQYLDLTDVYEYKTENLDQFNTLSTDKAKSQSIVQKMKYFKLSDDTLLRSVTVWVVADFESSEGLNLMITALKSLKHCPKTRIGFLPNMKAGKSDYNRLFKLLYTSAATLPAHQSKLAALKILSPEFLKKILSDENFKPQDLEVHGVSWSVFERELAKIPDTLFTILTAYVKDILNFEAGQNGVIANGQIIGPFSNDEDFTTEDFRLLEKYISTKLADSIAKQLTEWQVSHENEKSSDLTMRVCALMAQDPTKKKRVWISLDEDKHSSVSMASNDTTRPTFDIMAVIDPLSADAQRIIPWLLILPNVINVDLKLALNCRAKLSEMPLKNFYRFVLQPELEFTEEGSMKSSPFARFSSLPRKTLLTLNLISPPSWLVESKKAIYDLDNIKMGEVKGDIVALFELEHLLLEGHCFDDVTGNPPRGLQFTLGTKSNPLMFDTIVMANLGYFQLKANPGTYVLRLREGKSVEIYDITSHENTDSPVRDFTEIIVGMNSFSGRIIRIRVTKKPDKLEEHLLMDQKDMEEQTLWNSLKSKLVSSNDQEKATEINIFSLASGHLYERFLRIMMRSVTKHAKLPVKFWLLKNYLSPDFKEFLPYYAQHYNFSYELVQYKWPRWLHQETVKQRLMWGYKILFLDVLFPLDVKKIIFVDADQVVRVNMQELMDLDLEGAPYAYTPFCDSRTDMEGYRFWKKGYWASHMGNRKYHISALYVVDLKKFRQIAAGDRLRGQYQGLSSDANSLSNLDQDLPNNMIHQVKIKSLPQDWLWCETWCDNGSKANAKTIDLCNNPQTKEPKLESAMRIIGEWKDYDGEIRALKDQFDSLSKKDQSASPTLHFSPTGAEKLPSDPELDEIDSKNEL